MANSKRFVWHELVSSDPKKALGFFSELFGWKTQDLPMGQGKPYTMLVREAARTNGRSAGAPSRAGSAECGAPFGGLFDINDFGGGESFWMSYVWVDDVKASAEAAGKHGGQDFVAGLTTVRAPGTEGQWLPWLTVHDADETARRAKALGASLLQEPGDIPHVGRGGVMKDPTGAPIAFIKFAH